MRRDDDNEFRLRPRKPPISRGRDDAAAWSVAFKTVMHYMRASRAGKRATGTSRGSGGQVPIPKSQRCAVRVTYAGNAVRGQWRAHARYLARERATEEPGAPGFDRAAEGIDIGARVDAWQAARDQRLWKIIVSPEFGDRVDLTRLTRDLMQRVERDMGIPLEWAAVAHYNTEHPHAHIALRGVGPNRQAIRLDREYVRHGIRSIAEDLCTQQLGHRTQLDAIEAERREIREKRFTSLDRAITRSAQPVADTASSLAVTVAPPGTIASDVARAHRQHIGARLSVLEDMGLAHRYDSSTWTVRSDFETVLRAMQRASDRQKMLTAHGVLMSDERLRIEIIDLRKTTSVEGRVLVHGEDEQSGRSYLMLEGTDGRIHFIHYTPEMEAARARGELQSNSFARLSRVLVDDEPTIQVQDLGDSEAILDNRRHLKQKAESMVKQGTLPLEDGWGGWLGRYQKALRRTAMQLEYSDQTHERRERGRHRSFSR
jgi:type IV secretory pathway VirD2 relaxase